MAVSLKKRVKVDLSKPELTQKVRKYTPVHLMDEEETIKQPLTETEVSPPCSSDPVIQADDVTELVRQVKIGSVAGFVGFRFSRGLIIVFGVLGAILAFAFILLFCYFAPRIVSAILFQGSETDGQSFIDAFDNIYKSPFFLFMLLLSVVLFWVRCIKKFLDVGRF